MAQIGKDELAAALDLKGLQLDKKIESYNVMCHRNTMAKCHGTTEEKTVYSCTVFWNHSVWLQRRMTGDGDLDSQSFLIEIRDADGFG